MSQSPKHPRHDGFSQHRPWLERYPAGVPHHLGYPAVPAYELLRQTADRYPKRAACLYYEQRLTYRELEQQALRLAGYLSRIGVQPGDRVGLLLPNIPEFLTSLNAIWMVGATAVVVSPLMVPQEASDLLQATDCQIVIGLDLLAGIAVHGHFRPSTLILTSLRDRLRGWKQLGYAFARLQRLGFGGIPGDIRQISYEDAVRDRGSEFTPLTIDSVEQPAFILPTGGTTGHPKAVVLSHRNLVANAWQLHHWGGALMGRETILSIVPFFHSYGLSTCAMTGTAMAATLVLHHRFIPRVVRELMETHRPTVFNAVPAMLSDLNDLFREHPLKHRSLNACMSGGAPLTQSIGEEFADHTGAIVVEGFGLSEASPVTHAGPLDGTAQSGTIGLPLPDTDVRIVDSETGLTELPSGEVGEMIVRGPQVMLGYWNDPEATDLAIRDGWLYTGDLARMSDDGFFQIVDRKKDLIITSGFNVYPNEVEHILRGCEGVVDVAIVGEPDTRRGQIVKAIVVPKSGQKFNMEQFQSYAAKHLSKHKVPRLVELSQGDLPRNFLGKVQRRRLRTASTVKEGLDSDNEEHEAA